LLLFFTVRAMCFPLKSNKNKPRQLAQIMEGINNIKKHSVLMLSVILLALPACPGEITVTDGDRGDLAPRPEYAYHQA
jgi:hypothetical protein